MAYVPAGRAARRRSSAADDEQLAVRLSRAPTPAAVTAALGASATPATGAIGRGVPLVAVLRSILRAVAIVDGLVCLYALIQACALTVQERRAHGVGAARVRRRRFAPSGAC